MGRSFSVIYFLKCNSYVKIGLTALVEYVDHDCVLISVKNRIGQLQTGNPYKITCIGVLLGDRGMEQTIHRELAEYHVRGEWFKITPKVQRMIDAASTVEELDAHLEAGWNG